MNITVVGLGYVGAVGEGDSGLRMVSKKEH